MKFGLIRESRLKLTYTSIFLALALTFSMAVGLAVVSLFFLPRQDWPARDVVSSLKTIRDWTRPSLSWQPATPESQGMDGAKLDALAGEMAARNSSAFLVVRNGLIVYEWYAEGNGPKTKFSTAGLTQSLAGSLVLMLALDAGRIQLDDPAWEYIPQWRDDPVRSKITIRQLASESSGLDNVSFLYPDTLEGWKKEYYLNPEERFSMAINKVPIINQPGTATQHSGPGQHALAYALAASLRDVQNLDVHSLLWNGVMKPIGVPKNQWAFSHGRYYDVDGLKVYTTGSGAKYTARAIARVGQLLLNRGNWEGAQLLAPELIEMMTSYARTPVPKRSPGNPEPATGLGWRVNFDLVWPNLPRDAYAGGGDGDNVMLVVPSLDLIVVRSGKSLGTPRLPDSITGWGAIGRHLFEPISAAITTPTG